MNNDLNQFERYNIIIRNQNKALNEKDKKIAELNVRVAELKRQIVEFQPKKPFFESSERCQRAVKEKLLSQVKIINTNIQRYGILIKELSLCLIDEDDVRENNKIKISFYNNYFPIENPIDIRYVLYIKDRYLISDKKYQIIRKHFNENLPSLNKIKKLRKQLNDNHHIFHSNFVSNNPAKYVDIKESIKKKLFEYLSSLPEQELNNLGALREDKRKLGIKLCADGTNVGKNIFLVNFCYT